MKIILSILIIPSLLITNFSFGQLPATKQIVDRYSLSSFYLVGTKNGNRLWNATAFLVEVKQELYLITNNHVFGGEYYIEEFKRDNGGKAPTDFPDTVYIRLYNRKLMNFNWYPVALNDSIGRHKWIKFYDNDKDPASILDIAAIKLTDKFPADTAITILDTNIVRSSLSLRPGAELFVVGFPHKTGETTLYPFWKRGTIATDANLADIGMSKFYIDATTRQGMSGSPVFFRSTIVEGLTGGLDFYTSPMTYFVGIYSAQNPTSELGVVTRCETIFGKLLNMP